MKILFVVHQFLPRHQAGTELYTYYLAKELVQRGHELCLFFTEIRNERQQHSLQRGTYDGLPYFEVVHNRYFPTFRHTYLDHEMERIFAQILDEVSPDIVHFQHLFLHSIGYVDIAKRHRLPIVYTLHEYILMCLRMGQLLRPGLVVCEGPEPTECARCARIYPPPDSALRPVPPPPTGLGKMAAGLRSLLGLSDPPPETEPPGDPYLPAVELRQQEIKSRLDQVDLFLAPSDFLRQRFLGVGMIAPERILHSDNGFPRELFEKVPATKSPDLRVGFVGTISDFKGIHLLVEAFAGIEDPSIRCRIYGDLDVFPDYKERLLAQEGISRVELMGVFDHARIAEVLADIDVLVLPSLWFENSPLTIHEAFLAEVPVLAANRGGMAELVRDGENGLHFEMGDADDLRAKILRLRDEPGLLGRLRRFPVIKTIAEDAADMERRYGQLVRGELPAA